MTIEGIDAAPDGRQLRITVGDLDPFLIAPLPGDAGKQVTDVFLRTLRGEVSVEEITDAFALAADGGTRDDDGTWRPIPVEQRVNLPRFDTELRLQESETVCMLALVWQMHTGLGGVRAYLDAGDNVAGQIRVTNMLALRIRAGQKAPAA